MMAENPVTADQDAPDIDPGNGNPFTLLSIWLREAFDTEIPDVTAMALSTVDEDGMPDVRMVLAKDIDENGISFYTNLESDKAKQLAVAPQAAAVFHWKTLRRQLRVRGPVVAVSLDDADAYFATRHPQAQIAARISKQSQTLEGRDHMMAAFQQEEARLAGAVPARPDNWSGYRLIPTQVEFWQNRAFRLHDRLVFERENPGSTTWNFRRLYP